MRNQIGCVIVDDEPLAINILKKYIEKHESLYLVHAFSRSEHAISYLQQNNIDLLLLDIHMPLINGIELLKKLSHPPLTIFTTAYRDYAVEGFELNATDYLVKPIRYERFAEAIKKIKQRINLATPNVPQSAEHVLDIKVNRKNYRIPLKDILYLESNRNNVLIYTTKEQLKCVNTIKHMTNVLPQNFIQIHRSFIVNKNFVKHYNKQSVTLVNVSLPVGSMFSDMMDNF